VAFLVFWRSFDDRSFISCVLCRSWIFPLRSSPFQHFVVLFIGPISATLTSCTLPAEGVGDASNRILRVWQLAIESIGLVKTSNVSKVPTRKVLIKGCGLIKHRTLSKRKACKRTIGWQHLFLQKPHMSDGLTWLCIQVGDRANRVHV
jgi:hypothetical protein